MSEKDKDSTTNPPASDDVKAGAEKKETQKGKETASRRHLIRSAWLRIPLKILMWIIVAVILIPVLLYIPPVQTFVKDVAAGFVYRSTGMKIEIGSFRLRWPLDVSLEDVAVVEATGDTMVYAKNLIADVKLVPLLKMDVDINRLQLTDGAYRMVSPDSSMILKIKAGWLEVDDRSSMDIADSRILLNKAVMRKGSVSLMMDVWKQKPSPQDSTSAPFYIQAGELQLEDFTFAMSMLPTIDTLDLTTSHLTLRNGVIDLGKNSITASYLSATGGDVTYLTPTPEYIVSHPAPAADTSAPSSAPMVIRGDTVMLNGFRALYAVKGAEPLPGFDPSYIEVTGVNVTVADFYNAASDIRLPITRMEALERSGLRIMEGEGTVAMDSAGLSLEGLNVSTPYSSVSATAGLPFALMEMKPEAPLNVNISGSIGMPDAEAFMPSLKPVLSQLPARYPLNVRIEAGGTLARAEIPELDVSIPGVFSLNASGYADDALDYRKLRGKIDLDGEISNPGVIERMMGKTAVRIPKLKISGDATANRQSYGARFTLLTSAGDVAAKGAVSIDSERYGVDMNVRDLDVARIMPDLGVGAVTAKLSARGAGFDPTRKNASTDVSVDISSIVYQKKILRDITADVTLHDGVFRISAMSGNPGARFDISGNGTVSPDLYTFDLSGHLRDIDLRELGLTPDANHGKGDISVKGSANPEKWLYDVTMGIDSLEWTVGNQFFALPGRLTADFHSSGDKVTADVGASLTSMRFSSSTGLKDLLDTFAETSDSLTRQIARRDLDVEGLQQALPPFTFAFNASGHGVVGRYLNTIGMSVDTIYARLANDSLLHGNFGMKEISRGTLGADTITFNLRQRGKLLDYYAHMGNRANSALAEFADVNVNGYIGSNRLFFSLTQMNQQGETGYRLGMTGAVTDTIATIHFTPLKATIAYLPWKFNTDNHVDINLNNFRIDANLAASSKESSILMKTQKGDNGDDQLHVALSNIRIQDFLKMSVFAPPVTASVNADLNVGHKGDWIYGGGNIGVTDFTYDKLRVGDFDLGVRAGRNNDGSTGARLSLRIDNRDAMLAKVMLRPDSLGALVPQKMGIELTRFPLYVANPFLGKDVARLSGYLNGSLDMGGTFAAPVLNGSIACDSVGVFVPMIGSSLKFGEDSVTVSDNVITLREFDIWGANRNPLVINGDVDARKFSSVVFRLDMKGSNFQLIGNDKRARSDIYGKLFLDMDATASGTLDHMNVNADVSVLSNTDVVYSVSQATAQLSQQDASGIVKFVNFNDTTAVEKADSVSSALSMRIVAALNIQPGAAVEVDIPGTATTGNGKVELSPSGTLNYFQNYMGDMRLNGQLNLGNGYVRYNVPMMGEKRFKFDPSSNVNWRGDLMNPTLNITATDNVKANLLQDGNSRIVNFLVKLAVSNTLSAPKVVFDLSTEDDMSIQNELMSMSADQRSMAAINLLLTGQYSGQGVKTASNDLLQGQLYGLLTSQLNSWLANNVKGVDLSFGVDQYNKTVNGETGSSMSYSYTMSKSLFDNRFKISVGGNYTTDASADENFSENLISDISFEYILKQTNSVTMYLRLFRHTGYESILEGEITETGVGFVMKRRLANLRNLFRLRTWKGIPIPDPAPDEVPQEKEDAAAVKTENGGDTGEKREETEEGIGQKGDTVTEKTERL